MVPPSSRSARCLWCCPERPGKDALRARTRKHLQGLENAIKDRMNYTEKVCHADPMCHNECKLKIYDFDGRRSIWGGECGRYELTKRVGEMKENRFKLREKVWQIHMKGVYEQLHGTALMEVEGRPTVGMQRGLYGIHGAVLWAHFSTSWDTGWCSRLPRINAFPRQVLRRWGPRPAIR